MMKSCCRRIFDFYTRLPYAASQTMFTRFTALQDVTSSPLLSGVQGLFRNFGATFVPLLRPHLEKLAVDSQVWMYIWSRCEALCWGGENVLSSQLDTRAFCGGRNQGVKLLILNFVVVFSRRAVNGVPLKS